MDPIRICLVVRMRTRRLREARRRQQLHNQRVHRFHLRSQSAPFQVSDQIFMERFRLTKELARRLIDEMTPFMRQPQRTTGIDPEIKVLCALQFYAHGSYQTRTGNDYDLVLSQPTVCRAIEEVTHVLVHHFLRGYVNFPSTREERQAIILKNFRRFNMPGVLGYVDCTHVAIKRPQIREDMYLNRERYHSINVQIACDSDLLILNVNPRYPGGTDDEFIWSLSALRDRMMAIYRGGENCWLLGDSSYPEEPWLHVPILDPPPNTKESRYTDMHCSARNCVERCIRLLKNRWRCLLKARVLQYAPLKVTHFINACAVLHNYCVLAGLPEPDELGDIADEGVADADDHIFDTEDEDEGEDGNENRQKNPLLVEGERVRYQHLIDVAPIIRH